MIQQKLTDETTLSEQCIQGVGVVQVNLELKSVENIDRINILDVLKPQQEDESVEEISAVDNFETISTYVEPNASQQANLPILNQEDNTYKLKKFSKDCGVKEATISPSCSAPSTKGQSFQKTSPKVPATSNENITRWVVDTYFRKEQERMKIPLGILIPLKHLIMLFMFHIIYNRSIPLVTQQCATLVFLGYSSIPA